MDQLDESSSNIKQATCALERAHATNDLNERLRCLHNARLLINEAWNQIVEWRKGDEQKDDRQDACPTDSHE